MFLIKQLRGLEDPNSPTFKRYFYLLEVRLNAFTVSYCKVSKFSDARKLL